MKNGKSIIDYLPERNRVVSKTLKDVIKRFKFLVTFKQGDSFTGNRYTNNDTD